MHSTGEREYERRAGATLATRFRSQQPLGEDAAARYLSAVDVSNGDRVVIVVARPLADAAPPRNAELADARIRQARAAAVLSDDDAGMLVEVGRTEGGHPFVVSSLGDSVLLAEQLKAGRALRADRALAIAIRAAESLERAHELGIIHGSIGPATMSVGMRTILTGAVPAAVLLHGFGIAAPALPAPAPLSLHDGHGELADEPPPLPEAVVRAMHEDVRRLALVLRAMLTGAESPNHLQSAIIPRPLRAPLDRALAGAEGMRTAAQLRAALSAVSLELRDPPASETVIPAGRRPERHHQLGWWAFGVLALAIAAVSAIALLRPDALPLLHEDAGAAADAADSVVTDSAAALISSGSAALPVVDTAATPAARRAPAEGAGPRATASAARETESPAASPERTATRARAPTPTPPSASPRPPTRAPIAAVAGADDRAGVSQVIANYARAIESGRVAALADVYPGLSPAERTRWASFFAGAGRVHAALQPDRIMVLGDTATARVSGVYTFDDLATLQRGRTAVLFEATLVRRDGRWQLRSIR